MMRLLIDIGNSRIKWAWCDSATWQGGAMVFAGENAARLLERIGEPFGCPHTIGIVCVAEESVYARLSQHMQDKWSAEIVRITSARELAGVRNGYVDPAQLGDDRWAALIGARGEMRTPLCVINSGTATTVDAMTAEGDFIGGTILPGLGLMRQSLRRGTAAIDVTAGRGDSCLGRTTADAVSGGIRFGLVGAISRIVAEQERALGRDTSKLITGGDAESIAPLLAFPVRHVPDLVLMGVRRVLEMRS